MMPQDWPTAAPDAADIWRESERIYALSLDQILEQIWQVVELAARDRHQPFHQVSLATTDADGYPSTRVLTFRGFERDLRRFRMHSDARHALVPEIEADPRVCLHFYDKPRKLQCRFYGRAAIHSDDDLADSAWSGTRAFSRRCYLADEVPGEASPTPTSGLSADLERRNPGQEESEAGRKNFRVVTVTAERLDWLYLAARGQRRARFSWDSAGQCTADWLVP